MQRTGRGISSKLHAVRVSPSTHDTPTEGGLDLKQQMRSEFYVHGRHLVDF